jgi:hypothetical protein
METFGFAPWMTARAKRLRLYRLLGNSFWYYAAICLLAGFLRWALPQLSDTVGFAFVSFAALFAVLAIPWLIVSWGFQFGLIKCPSCALRPGFHRGSRRPARIATMTSTHLDIAATSNQRLERP